MRKQKMAKKTTKKSTNGHSNGHSEESLSLVKPAPTGPQSLKPEEAAQIEALWKNVERAKAELGDLDFSVALAEQKRAEGRALLAQATQAYQNRVIAAAKDHGLENTDTTYNFDVKSMAFTPSQAA
jgi:hypothetical protein